MDPMLRWIPSRAPVWILQLEANDVAFERNLLLFQIVGSKRVVGRGRRDARQGAECQSQQRSFHELILTPRRSAV